MALEVLLDISRLAARMMTVLVVSFIPYCLPLFESSHICLTDMVPYSSYFIKQLREAMHAQVVRIATRIQLHFATAPLILLMATPKVVAASMMPNVPQDLIVTQLIMLTQMLVSTSAALPLK